MQRKPILGACVAFLVVSSGADASTVMPGLDMTLSDELAPELPIRTRAANVWGTKLAFDGRNHLAVWSDRRAGRYGVVATRVAPDGTVLDPDGIDIFRGAWPDVLIDEPQVAYGDGVFLVVWAHSTSVYWSGHISAARVTSDGVVLDPGGFLVSTAAGGQTNPAVAYGASEFLVAWLGVPGDGIFPGLYAARVNSSGAVLDPAGIQVEAPSATFGSLKPAVASSAATFLVAYGTHEPFTTKGDFRVRRISPGGTVLGTGPLVLTTTPAGVYYGAALASDGSDFLAVWSEARNGYDQQSDLYAARISGEGVLEEPGVRPIAATPNYESTPSIAFDGTDYLVGWQAMADWRVSASSVWAVIARVARDGTVVGSPLTLAGGRIYESDAYLSAIAFGGGSYLVAWNDYLTLAGYASSGSVLARVAPDGTFLGLTGSAEQGANEQVAPVATFDGTGYLFAWTDYRDIPLPQIRAERVSVAGAPLDPVSIAIPALGGVPSDVVAAGNGKGSLLAWQELRTSAYDLVATRVTPAGEVLPPVVLATGTSALAPAVASDGEGWLVAWTDTANEVVAFTILTAQGQPALPQPVSISGGSRGAPSVAYGSGTYLVTWIPDDQYPAPVVAVRVAGDGRVLDAVPFRIAAAPWDLVSAAVTSSGDGFLVVWTDPGADTSEPGAKVNYDIRGARVALDGTVLDPGGIGIATLPGNEFYPVVGFNGGRYVVSWQTRAANRAYDLYVTAVGVDGAVSPPAGVCVVHDLARQFMMPFSTVASDAVGTTLIGYARNVPESPFRAQRVRAELLRENHGAALVAPPVLHFGDVRVGVHGAGLVTISNVGAGPLTVSAVAADPGNGPFSVGPLSLPLVLPAAIGGTPSTLDIPITFAPVVAGAASATLSVTTDDFRPAMRVVHVPFDGNGVRVETPPEMLADILTFFDASVAAGRIAGAGSGNSAAGRLSALRNMFKAAGDLLQAGRTADACQQLADAYQRIDGLPRPPDFATSTTPSDDVATLRTMIISLRAAIGCT